MRQKAKKEQERTLQAEAAEKQSFLALSDREKRALAAERRFLQQEPAIVDGARAVLKRCFECGADITGKVPFEYSNNVFCSVKCVKEHRAKHPCQ